jgi:hypothetical protein
VTQKSLQAVLCVVFTASLSFHSGCGSSKAPETTSKPASEASISNGLSEEDRCRQKLASAMQKLTPSAMATQTRRDSVVNSLNSWLTSCHSEKSGAKELSEANAARLSNAAVRYATGARFTENDALYIRDCLLLRGMAEQVWKAADAAAPGGVATDADRVVRLFSEVIRNVVLMDPAENRVPVSLYEVLLTGRGRVEDRIWIFSEALRQRQLDAVLLRCSAPPESGDPGDLLKSAEFLIAAIIEKRILLFDPVRGTAVPLPGDTSPLVSAPAGLPELAASPRWKRPSVQLIVHPASISPRMRVLQDQLAAENSAVLYEELAGGGSEIQPLMERVAACGSDLWKMENIQVWDYPEKTSSSAVALSESDQQAYALLLKPYDAPFERDPLKSREIFENPGETDEQLSEEVRDQRRREMLMERMKKIEESSDELFGKASKRLLLVRIDQVMGDSDVGMIQQLQQIRIASMQDVVEVNVPLPDKKEAVIPYQLPEAIRQVHRNATGDSLFWTSQCQVARGDYGASVNTFRNYRKQYSTEKWVMTSFLQEAISLILMGNFDAAVTALKAADLETNPDRLQVEWLLARLPKTEESKTEEPKTEEPKTEEPKTEEPKTEEPKTEEPKTEEPKTEEPKTEEPKTEESKTEEPKTEEPKTEEPKTEEPKTEEPKTEEPKTEEPKTEEPKTEEPKTEEPKTEEPTPAQS